MKGNGENEKQFRYGFQNMASLYRESGISDKENIKILSRAASRRSKKLLND